MSFDSIKLARFIAAILVAVGLVACGVAVLASSAGLGTGDQFFLHKIMGLGRKAVFEGGILVSGFAAVIRLSLYPKGAANPFARPVRCAARALASTVALGRPDGKQPSPPRLLMPALTGFCIFLSVVTVGITGFSLLSGLDTTDEGLYLYELTRSEPAARFFISPVLRDIGAAFHNNILVWRFIGLALLTGAAALFASAMLLLLSQLALMRSEKRHRIVLACGAISGALAFYAYGPPTFSYRMASSIGVLLAYAGLIRSYLAPRPAYRELWQLLGCLGALLMALSRPPAVLPYAVSLLILAVLLAKRGRGSLRVFLWHGLLVAALACLVPLLFSAEFTAIFHRLVAAGQSTYRPQLIVRQHFDDLLRLPRVAAMTAARVIAVAACIVGVMSLFGAAFRRAWPQFYLSDVLVCACAISPLFLIGRYFAAWPAYVAEALSGCADREMLACQGPTPAQTGRDFLEIVVAQLFCAALLLVLNRFTRPPAARGANAFAWCALILFLMIGTTATSFYTDVGWFYHVILSLAPLVVASYIFLACLPSQPPFPAWAAVIAVIGLQVGIGLDVLHNRILFPHRRFGGEVAQSERLTSPAALAGLYVSPRAKDIIEQVRTKLGAGGFVASRDIVLAPYSMPGVIVALGARAFATPWLTDSAVDCGYVEADKIDLAALGRIYVISDAAPSKDLYRCLEKRGVDLSRERSLGTVQVDRQRSIRLFEVPLT